MVQGQSSGFSQTKRADRDRPPPEESVREELNRVLASHGVPRSQDSLRYVVENALAGHADMLKERIIGIEVFGRSTSLRAKRRRDGSGDDGGCSKTARLVLRRPGISQPGPD